MPEGRLAGQSADDDSEESVTVTMGGPNQPGVWTAVVDGYSAPAATTTYRYVDVFARQRPGAHTNVLVGSGDVFVQNVTP